MLDQRVQHRQRTRNAVQSTLLLGCLLVVGAGLAWLLFAAAGLLGALVVTGLLVALRPRVPPRVLLGLFRATPLPVVAAPQLHGMLTELAARAGLRHEPALYYVPSPVPNCFCVGHGADAALAVTDGLLRRLPRREVAGVLAHEMGHLRAGDPAVMTLSDAIGWASRVLGVLGLLGLPVAVALALDGRPGLLLPCAVLGALPFGVTLLQLALSRSREFDADLAAARLTGDPEGLACALELLEQTTGPSWERVLLGGGRLPDPLLLRTHPPTRERARRLRALEPGGGDRWYAVGRQVPPSGYPHVLAPPRWRRPDRRR